MYVSLISKNVRKNPTYFGLITLMAYTFTKGIYLVNAVKQGWFSTSGKEFPVVPSYTESVTKLTLIKL